MSADFDGLRCPFCSAPTLSDGEERWCSRVGSYESCMGTSSNVRVESTPPAERLAAFEAARRALDVLPPVEDDDEDDDRARTVAYLRSLDSRALRGVLHEAAIADGWRDFDEDGVPIEVEDEDSPDVETSTLEALGDHSAATAWRVPGARWAWRAYPPGGKGDRAEGRAPTLDDARRAAEDAAIAAGWRLPWRDEIVRRGP